MNIEHSPPVLLKGHLCVSLSDPPRPFHPSFLCPYVALNLRNDLFSLFIRAGFKVLQTWQRLTGRRAALSRCAQGGAPLIKPFRQRALFILTVFCQRPQS